ncbi:hypothetical protein J1N35_025198 [Gossypium stocksii]|uniref:Retrovirus-related Pol polyprotein from transposon TNT 1-94-like beta-barrel domain-containing protein n=1 Tax=Gossypium stocksii TaxID=47602 RepID=A0A9D3ZVZ2_9ROSI|nr:hypothetical protein J1N35_025198 [Gossypium stocksii]
MGKLHVGARVGNGCYTYSSLESGVVCMKNGSLYKITGICNVQIKMHSKIISTLSDVRQVLDLKKNLIFLSLLDSKKYRIIIESSGIKVSHGALVLIRGRKTGNPYVLQGLTVISVVAISSTITESELTRCQFMEFDSFRLGSRSVIKSFLVFKIKHRI